MQRKYFTSIDISPVFFVRFVMYHQSNVVWYDNDDGSKIEIVALVPMQLTK